MLRSTLVIIVLLAGKLGAAQAFKFRTYNEQDGLNNKFIYAVNQDQFGYLMVGTGEGLYQFDGFKFSQYTTSDGLADDFITCSLKDAEGYLWYGHGNGFITKVRNGIFEKIDLSSLTVSRINQIYQDSDRKIWAVSQNDGLLQMQTDGSWQKINKGIEEFTLYSFCKDNYGGIWLGTDMGLLQAQIEQGGDITYEFCDVIMETKVSCIHNADARIYVATEDAGLYEIDLGNGNAGIHEILFDSVSFSKYNLNHIFIDGDKNMWLSTNNNGLLQLGQYTDNKYHELLHYSQSYRLTGQSIRQTFVDMEGNVWMGSTGEGLLKLEDDYFSVFASGDETNPVSIFSVHERNDTIWYGSEGKIFKAYELPDNVLNIYDEENNLPLNAITCLHTDTDGTLWAGTTDMGLYVLRNQAKKFEKISLSDDNLNQRINDIIGFNDIVYVATDFGVYQLNERKIVSHISIQSGLTHNVIKSLFRDSKGRIWITTSDSQLSYIQDGVIKNLEPAFEGMAIESKCLVEDNEGNIWIGTDGSGVLKISDDSQMIYDKQSGLYSDYCYSVVCDNKNNLWVGHRGALSRIHLLTGKIEIVDPSHGFEYSFNENAVDKFPNGILLFGTDKGLLRYEPDKDRKNEIEPVVHITQLIINDSLWKDDFSMFDLSYGEYKVEINFIGVSLRNAEGVRYQYYLEGYDNDWTELTSAATATYSKLSSGEYTFRVRAYNSDGVGGNAIVSFKFSVDKPFWLKWWFIVVCIVAIIFSVRYIILQREKKLKTDQEYLQHALNEATHAVLEQKELLEVKNKDITDSIQYAKNIQKAILPSYESLHQYFDDAFVYFKPRDIVSGDFYWLEKFETDIVVSCADCTGHGVPGAFMSLIGTTLLKEVSRDKSVQCARDVLVRLDDDLRQLLNRSGSEFGVEDGMDISVFNYNLQKKTVMIASANRPVLLRIAGEWIELKGDRQSVGGSSFVNRKEFVQHEFPVKSGDLIYMFSDGITDQFGGVDGKKMKRSGLINIIKEVANESMVDQRAKVRQSFYDWKGDHAQIDDIIVMGIRF